MTLRAPRFSPAYAVKVGLVPSTRFYGVAHPTTTNRRQDLAVARQEIGNFGMKEKLAELGAEGLRARLRAEIDAAGPG